MHSSTMRKSRVVRKTGKCLRSYTCPNDECPRYRSGKGRNTYAFTSIGLNLFKCKTYRRVAGREFCGAMKLMKYHPDTNILEVFYAGKHMRIKNQEPLLHYVKEKEERCFKANSSEKPKGYSQTDLRRSCRVFFCSWENLIWRKKLCVWHKIKDLLPK